MEAENKKPVIVTKSEEAHSYANGAEVLQLRFSDGDGDTELSAWELAQALEGVSELTADFAKAGLFGEGLAPEVKVRPPHEGSFVLDFVVPVASWSVENPEAAVAVFGSPSALLAYSVRAGIKAFKGDRVQDYEVQGDGTVKVTWQSGETEPVPIEAWEELQKKKKKTRRSLNKILKPLQSGETTLEVRSGQVSETTEEIMDSTPIDQYTYDDFRDLERAGADEDVYTNEFEVEASFQSMDFKFGSKWKIISNVGRRMASMADPEFQQQLDNGLKIGKDDIFRVNILETVHESVDRYTTSWEMTSITRVRRGDGESLN